MGKDFLSYFLLVAAAIVAYVAVNDYLDHTMENNFTTSTVRTINKTAEDEIQWIGVEYAVDVADEEVK